jgi:hypothetical protein
MKMRLIPLFNTDESGGGATFEVNGQQMTAEQVVESYKKLQGEFTKVTQKNSEYSKSEDKVKGWLDFDQALDQLSQEKGINAKALAGQQLDGLIQNLASGKAPTVTQMDKLGKEIDKAESKGDEATVKKLEALESVVMEQEFEKNLSSIEKEAAEDNIPFDRKEFLAFADSWLDDMGISDDDDFDLKLLKKAYQAYEAKILKEQSKQPKIPTLSTSGGAGSPSKQASNEKVGGIKGAAQKAAAYFK